MSESDHNRNPSGKNQYTEDAQKEETVEAALRKYHRSNIHDYAKTSRLLAADYGIKMSAKTVQRRREKYGLYGGKKTMEKLSFAEAEQLVVTEMDRDVSKRAGVRTIRAKVAFNSAVSLPRALVSDIMHTHDSAAFDSREPTAKKIFRVPKYPVGIHERWSGDGHDKLYSVRFCHSPDAVYAFVEDASEKGLKAWICPSNRVGKVIAYLWLCLVEKHGGMPLQTTTDCGAETTELYAIVTALRALYHSEYDPELLPAHVYLRSVHNISVERSWYRLRLDFGDNAVLHFQEGTIQGWYRAHDPDQNELCQFLWSRILQSELDKTLEFRNGVKMRTQSDKPGPSGMSRNEAFSLYEDWGGKNCLLPIPVDIVQQMKADLGGDALLNFTSTEFAERAQVVLDSLGPVAMTLENGWMIFRVMLPPVFPERDDFPTVEL
ncbi:hypothetical protein GGX14DRAFT_372082 [Mycena pura]|uniref:Integrase catalytic domain-containing protein n=1 Tax=Mycena pura TaxID=153505 RepID=A0AAD6V627_9AGAR|nr:hypothetical protein GGX14DRAFT_372082 [Mycena pura]